MSGRHFGERSTARQGDLLRETSNAETEYKNCAKQVKIARVLLACLLLVGQPTARPPIHPSGTGRGVGSPRAPCPTTVLTVPLLFD